MKERNLLRTTNIISEIEIIPVKPKDGLIAFCTFVLFEGIYCSSIAIFTRLDGSYRLVYPTKQRGERSIAIFYPINKEIGKVIEEEVIRKLNELNDRHNNFEVG
ncbi:septation protein SpoVG family protein [Candidatus Dojkabacteria bacterium]|nr:septation protein SpoVG family protein [Candidatus Dojkabacteria bacterium]